MTLLKGPSNDRSVQQRTVGTPAGCCLQLYRVAPQDDRIIRVMLLLPLLRSGRK